MSITSKPSSVRPHDVQAIRLRSVPGAACSTGSIYYLGIGFDGLPERLSRLLIPLSPGPEAPRTDRLGWRVNIDDMLEEGPLRAHVAVQSSDAAPPKRTFHLPTLAGRGQNWQ